MEYPTQNANSETPKADLQRIYESFKDANSELSHLVGILQRSADTLKAMPLRVNDKDPQPQREPSSVCDHLFMQIDEANSTIYLLSSIVTHLQDTIGTK